MSWRHVVRLLILTGLSFAPSAAEAQAPAPPPRPKHEGSVEFAFVGVSGNAASNTFGVGAEFIARPGTWVFRHKLSFVRNESDGAVTSQALLYSPRAEKAVNARAGIFGEYAYFRDWFAGIENRHAVIGGVSLKVVTDARQTLALDLGAGYLSETRLAGANVSSGIYTVGTTYKLKLSATADVSDDVSFLGDASHSADWRVVHGVALAAHLTDGLSLKVSTIARYAHFPAPGFKTTDTVTSVALVAKFPAGK